MRRATLLASLSLVALAGLVPLPMVARADEALTVVSSDVSAYPDVRMVVAAPAQLGDQVLTDGAFRVTEGGQFRPARVVPLAADQLQVALAIDTSGSMVGAPLAAAKAAARSFLAQLPASVPVSVVGFGATSKVVSARSSDRAAQVAAVAGLIATGQTALYDALAASLTQLPADAGSQRVVVLLTDGGDTASAASLTATAAALAAARVPLYAVELLTSESNAGALRQLTSASSGRVVPASDPTALAGAFDVIAKQLVRQYSVTYVSQARGATDIDVVVEAQGVRAVARPHLELPAALAPSPTTLVPARSAPASSPLGVWALVAGGGLCGAALLVLLLLSLGERTPRARGLVSRRPGPGLAEAADRAEAVADKVLRRSGGVASVAGALEAAGIDIRPGELLLGVVAADLVLLGAAWALLSPLSGVILAAVVPLLARVGLDFMARRRRKRFTEQLAETLQILAGSLRAGHGLAQGIDTVAREAESPTAEEIRRMALETRLGRDFVEALTALADRMVSEDFKWVVQAIEIQRDVGGDLAEVLDSVAGTIRDRTRIRRQVSALSAEGRMSAWVLMILPFGLGGIMAVTNPDYLSPLFGSGTGYKLLAVAGTLLVVGGLWLRRIVKPIF
ncbi:MAG: type II secretion system F family protein [Actinomycetota bacterium]|nr:type II secretion system F family protein [Actinomycetota bacterium]